MSVLSPLQSPSLLLVSLLSYVTSQLPSSSSPSSPPSFFFVLFCFFYVLLSCFLCTSCLIVRLSLHIVLILNMFSLSDALFANSYLAFSDMHTSELSDPTAQKPPTIAL